MKKKIAAVSIYVFDFLEIKKKLDQLVKAGIQWIHVDIMDGEFVNNYALCQKFCQDIKKQYPQLIVDAHMMCLNSQRYIKSFAQAGCDYFIFHYESLSNKNSENLIQICQQVKKSGMKPILALNPETSIEVVRLIGNQIEGIMLMNILPGFNGQKIVATALTKIKNLKELRKELKAHFLIMTDGGCQEETYEEICDNGADVIVVGAFVNVAEQHLTQQVEKIQNRSSELWK